MASHATLGDAPAAETPARIGFVGLGIMGKPMARNLLKAGFPLVVHSRSRGPVDELAAEGAGVGSGTADVAAACDILITMLPDSPDVEAVYLGPGGAFEALRPGWLAIDMSTIAPRVARTLAARARAGGAAFIDAPVSGGDVGAIAGTLSIMAGGEPAAFERALPVFNALGSTIVHVGASGSGQVAKACNQVIVAGTIVTVCEALVLGAKAGVEPRRLVEVLSGGMAASRVLQMRGPNILDGHFEPGFRTRLHLKDLRIALELARETGAALPSAALAERLMQMLRAAGHGEEDHSALVKVFEDFAQFSVSRGGEPYRDIAEDA